MKIMLRDDLRTKGGTAIMVGYCPDGDYRKPAVNFGYISGEQSVEVPDEAGRQIIKQHHAFVEAKGADPKPAPAPDPPPGPGPKADIPKVPPPQPKPPVRTGRKK